jgi:hypothetical protein
LVRQAKTVSADCQRSSLGIKAGRQRLLTWWEP